MKFNMENTAKGLHVPAPAMKMSGFEQESMEFHALDGAGVILKKQMTAMEMVQAIKALGDLAGSLTAGLAAICGSCSHCQGEDADCPCSEENYIQVPPRLRAECGLPLGAKLCLEPGTEAGSAQLWPAGYNYDLRDVPKHLLDTFRTCGVCMGELEEHLIAEDTVYG